MPQMLLCQPLPPTAVGALALLGASSNLFLYEVCLSYVGGLMTVSHSRKPVESGGLLLYVALGSLDSKTAPVLN